MDLTTVGFIGLIAFWAGAGYFSVCYVKRVFWDCKHGEKRREKKMKGNKKRDSKRILGLAICSTFCMAVAYSALYLELGLFTREPGIQVFWPHLVAQTCSFPCLVAAIGSFLWIKHPRLRKMASALGFGAWVLIVIATFVAPDDWQFLFFGYACAPALLMLFLLYHGNNKKCLISTLFLLGLTAFTAFMFVTWALSPAGDHMWSLENSELIYLIANLAAYIGLYFFMNLKYVSFKLFYQRKGCEIPQNFCYKQ